MDTKMTQEELNEKLRERFKELPKVLQDAITSADVEKQLRELATKHKLHLDQWQLLENEVILTLIGFQPAEELADNLKKDLEMPEEMALALATDISAIVFEPVRQELERELEHPAAKEEKMSDVEVARMQILADEPVAGSQQSIVNTSEESGPSATSYPPSLGASNGQRKLQATSSVVPATPPSPPPTEKVKRLPAQADGPASGAYKPGEPSTARKSVHDDPYREPPR